MSAVISVGSLVPVAFSPNSNGKLPLATTSAGGSRQPECHRPRHMSRMLRCACLRCFGSPVPVAAPRDGVLSHRVFRPLARLVEIQGRDPERGPPSLSGAEMDDAVERALRLVTRGAVSPIVMAEGLRAVVDASPLGVGQPCVGRW